MAIFKRVLLTFCVLVCFSVAPFLVGCGAKGGNDEGDGDDGGDEGEHQFPAPIYITFDRNYVGMPAVTVVPANHLGKVSAPTDPIRGEYTFVGWFFKKQLGVKIDFELQVFTESTTVYARWEQQNISSNPAITLLAPTIAFNAAGEGIENGIKLTENKGNEGLTLGSTMIWINNEKVNFIPNATFYLYYLAEGENTISVYYTGDLNARQPTRESPRSNVIRVQKSGDDLTFL